MDMQMPEMDGYETTQIIREQLPAPVCHIPIIAVTASAIKSELKKCFELGMNGYIAKPFGRKELLEKIAVFYHTKESNGNRQKEDIASPSSITYTNIDELVRLSDGDAGQIRSI
jgi:DNA-binding response OmpR family regulator